MYNTTYFVLFEIWLKLGFWSKWPVQFCGIHDEMKSIENRCKSKRNYSRCFCCFFLIVFFFGDGIIKKNLFKGIIHCFRPRKPDDLDSI